MQLSRETRSTSVSPPCFSWCALFRLLRPTLDIIHFSSHGKRRVVVCTPLQDAARAEEQGTTERSIVEDEAQAEVVAEGEGDVTADASSPDETPSTALSADVPAAEPLVDDAAAVAASAGQWVALFVLAPKGGVFIFAWGVFFLVVEFP